MRRIVHEGQLITVDLYDLDFIGPSFPTILLAMMGHLAEDCGARVLLIPPKSRAISAYLDRIDFFAYARSIADFDTQFLSDINQYRSGKRSLTILEINRVSEESNTKSIINNILICGHDMMAANLHYKHSKIDTFLKIVAELCLNITDHSESWGVVLIQYLSYLENPVARISVVDKGIGIKASLVKKDAEYRSKNDCECIKAVLQGGMTRKEGRSLGLYAIRRFVNEWNGTMRVRSGTGKLSVSQTNIEKGTSGLIFFPGTHVDVDLPPNTEIV